MPREHGGLPEVNPVKCPNCGFVSFPGGRECKRCGQPMPGDPPAAGERASFRTHDRTFSSPLSAPEPSEPVGETPEDEIADAESDAVPSALDVPLAKPGEPWRGSQPSPRNRAPSDEPTPPSPKKDAPPWDDELAERVAQHRRRRAGATGDETKPNLEFDFAREPGPRRLPRSAAQFDAELYKKSSELAPAAPLDATPIDRHVDEEDDSHSTGAQEWALDSEAFAASNAAPPVEVFLESSAEEEEPEPELGPRLAAPLGPRFAAGMLDTLILLLAAGAFTLVFWDAGGRVEIHPPGLTLFVLAFSAAFFTAFYFWLFTAFAYATPGQAALHLRVRTLDNHLPDTRAAAWRGVGYLVSAASLLLGFLWAVFDRDGLTWHDHMSGTCLALRHERPTR